MLLKKQRNKRNTSTHPQHHTIPKLLDTLSSLTFQAHSWVRSVIVASAMISETRITGKSTMELNTKPLGFYKLHCGHACIFTICTKKGIILVIGTIDDLSITGHHANYVALFHIFSCRSMSSTLQQD